jgi:hypothetical protein
MGYMRFCLLAVILLAAGPLDRLAAQFGPPDTTTGPLKAATAFGFGLQSLDVAPLNAALAANGLPEIDRHIWSTGLSTELRFGRWDVAFAGSAILGPEQEDSVWRSQVRGSALMLGLGYALIAGEHWRVVPSGGVGLSRIGVRLQEVRGGTIDSVLADPRRGVDIDGQSGQWHVGLSLEYRVGRLMGQRLGVIAKGGYSHTFGGTSWRADENVLDDGPRASYGGPFLRAGIMMGIPGRRDALIPALISVIPWLSR